MRSAHGEDAKALLSLNVRPCPKRCARRRVEAGNLRHRLHRTLCDADGAAILDLNKRFGPACLRGERYERERSLASLKQLPLLRRTEEREIDRILVRFVRCKRAVAKHLSFSESRFRQRTCDRQPIRRECAGLVGTENVHVRCVFSGAEPRDQYTSARELHRAHCHAHSEHDRQRYRYRAHEQHQRQRKNFKQVETLHQRCCDGDRHQDADNQKEPFDHPRDDFFNVELRRRVLDKLRRAPEICPCPGRNDDGCRLPVPHDRA